jgi:hypothetical protein
LDVVKMLDGIPEGERDQGLFRYACRLRAKDIDYEEAKIIILGVASKCKPPFDEADTLKKLDQAWRYKSGIGETEGEVVDDTPSGTGSHGSHGSHGSRGDRPWSLGSHLVVTPWSNGSHPVVSADTSEGQQLEGGITAQLREFIKDSVGSFTTGDVDREFNLRTRKEKKARTRALSILINQKLILSDRVVRGKYHILDDYLDLIDESSPVMEHFPINLPLGLNNLVNLPPKSITVVAGTTSSGKTALLLSIAALKLAGDRPLLYLMSEMGRSEFLSRRNKLDVPLEQWKKMKAAERSAGFHAAIWNHNRDGITFVDFLEDVAGEYFKIPAAIREIYDALSDGIAVVAIQKRSDAIYARGGEGTAEKARLYLSVDLLCECDNFSVCSAKIVKAKDYGERANPNGKEIHFKLIRGTEIVPLTDWQRLNKDDREGLVEQYVRAFKAKSKRAAGWNNQTGKTESCPF